MRQHGEGKQLATAYQIHSQLMDQAGKLLLVLLGLFVNGFAAEQAAKRAPSPFKESLLLLWSRFGKLPGEIDAIEPVFVQFVQNTTLEVATMVGLFQQTQILGSICHALAVQVAVPAHREQEPNMRKLLAQGGYLAIVLAVIGDGRIQTFDFEGLGIDASIAVNQEVAEL